MKARKSLYVIADFDPIRSLMCRNILDTWHLGPGEISSAISSQNDGSIPSCPHPPEYGLRPAQLANELHDAKRKRRLDPSEFDRISPAREVDDILEPMSGALGIRQAEIQPGMTWREMPP